MAFRRDDDELALAVLRLCNAFEHVVSETFERRSPNSDAVAECIATARKHAQNVLSRGKRNQEPISAGVEPEPEGEQE